MAKITYSGCYSMLLLSVIFTFTLNAQQAIVNLPVSEQVQLADQIIEAEVLSSESFYDDAKENIYTKHTLKVYKVFKGQESATIDLIVQGGVVGLKAERVSHIISVRPGETGIFILKNLPVNRTALRIANQLAFESVGGDQSFFKFDAERIRAANPYTFYNDVGGKMYSELIQDSNLSQPIIISEYKSFNDPQNNTNSVLREAGSVAEVNSFSAPQFTGGTKSVLTIIGQGFGNDVGTVAFSNSDYGGYLKSDVLPTQILSWADNEVKVEIPEFAGSGKFTVKTSTGELIESGENININYAQVNMEYDLGSGKTAFNTRHIGENGDGGYTFTMNRNFANTTAPQAFQRAFDNWSCQSGMNWDVDTQTTNENKDIEDGINIITFDENNQLSAGKLAQCKSRYQGCYEDDQLKWYVIEIDLIFNDRDDWYTGENSPGGGDIDLESVALHELGHAHQLNHVIATDKVMHYSFVAGDMKRDLSNYDLEGAMNVQTRSTSAPVCGQLTMTNVSCSTLGIDDLALKNEITIYPNPATSFVRVRNRSNANIETIEIFAINGSRVKKIKPNSTQQISLDVSSLSQGLYMMKLQTDLGSLMHKLVVN